MDYKVDTNISERTRVKEVSLPRCESRSAAGPTESLIDKISFLRYLSQSMASSLHQSQRSNATRLKNLARERGSTQLSGDTILLSHMSEQTFEELDGDFSPDCTDMLSQQGKRKKNQPRDLVDKEHLCKLVAAYNVHFEKYSTNRSQTTQLIPSVVWKATYASYKNAYPGSLFKQDSLKERLRETIKELKTGTSNNENAEKVALQCNEVMTTLRCTDGHAKRNILRKRQDILQNMLASDDMSEGTRDSSDSFDLSTPTLLSREDKSELHSNKKSSMPDHELPSTPVKSKKKKTELRESTHMTKAQMLYKQSMSIEKLVKVYERSSNKREALVELKINQNFERQKKHRIANLKAAMALGIIDKVDFKVWVKEVLEEK